MSNSSWNQTAYLIGGPVCGAVTSTSAVVKASIRNSVKHARLVLSTSPTLEDPDEINESGRWQDEDMEYKHDIVTFELGNLTPNTDYYYGVKLDSVLDAAAKGRFKTFPSPGDRAAFSFACAGCCDGENSSAFDGIRSTPGVLFFVHLGDMHYWNPKKANVAKRLDFYDQAATRPGQAALMKRMPLAYIWDDHDFYTNDRGGDSDDDTRKARGVARDAYDAYFPHYPFPNGAAQQGVYQSFEVGRVLFILADNRYNQSAYGDTDDNQKQVLGAQQLAWLGQLFDTAANYDLVVMTSSYPWIGEGPNGNHGNWSEYHTARGQLANLIKAKNVSNLCMIGADAHMLAIDDGSHSGYANVPGTDGSGGFPVFVAGPLDNQGSHKGGPYSHGAKSPGGGTQGPGVTKTGIFSSNRQFGLCEVTYPHADAPPVVTWTGWRAEGANLEKQIWYEFRGGQTAPNYF